MAGLSPRLIAGDTAGRASHMKEHDLFSAFRVIPLAGQTCKISLPAVLEGALAGAAQDSQKKGIRGFDSKCFLGELQGVPDGDVMEDGEQVWRNNRAEIWGWPWCWLEKSGDFCG